MNKNIIFNPKIATFMLGLSMFFTGASGLINEYVLSTVSTYILGSSIEQFSITIALMMLMMGIGGFVQKFFSDNNLIEKFIFIEILLAIIGSFSSILIYVAFSFVENHFLLIYYFFVVFIGFLIGFEIPFIIRINQLFAKELKSNLSVIIASDYIGSFIGALIWIYILLPNFILTQISFIVTSLNFIIAFLTFLYFIKFGFIKRVYIFFIFIIFTFILLLYGFLNVHKWQVSLEQYLYDDKVIVSKTTKYQHLTITHNKALDEYRLYINGNIQFSSLDEARYHESLVHPIIKLVKNHSNILILGGGDGLVLKQLQQYKNIKSITLVDLDDQIVEFAKNNSILTKLNNNAFNNSKIHILNNKSISSDDIKSIYKKSSKNQNDFIAVVDVINIDAYKFLHKIKSHFYDVIIMDFPDPSSIELNKLYSKEFFSKLKRVLNKNGMLVLQATSSYHSKEAYLCIGRTLKSVLFKTIPFHENIPSFGDWGFYLAWDFNMSEDDMRKKIHNLDFFDINTTYLTTDIFKRSLIFGKDELKSDKSSINTLMRPELFYLYKDNSWLNY
jgi:spermidine synthase